MSDEYAENLSAAIKAMAARDEAAIVTQWVLVVEVATHGDDGLEFSVVWNTDGVTPWSAEGMLRRAICGINADDDDDDAG